MMLILLFRLQMLDDSIDYFGGVVPTLPLLSYLEVLSFYIYGFILIVLDNQVNKSLFHVPIRFGI